MSSTAAEPTSVSGSSLGPADDRPLTDQEFQLLQRLLSDPFSFPAPYKSWLISYLETSDMNLPISAINGLTQILGIAGIGSGTLGIFPAGLILSYGGAVAPAGSKLCDGASYDTTAESRLFTAIQYAYGGSGANFNVPDLRGRTLVGVGTHADVNALNRNDGQPVAQRTPRHGTSISDPGHSHGVSDPSHNHNDSGHNHNYFAPRLGGAVMGSGSGVQIVTDGTTTGIANIQPSVTGIGISGAGTGVSVGAGPGRPQDMPAFETVNFIIVS